MNTWAIIPSDSDMIHSLGFHKYIDKIRTKTGKWRYIYKKNNELRNKVKSNAKKREDLIAKSDERVDRIKDTERKIIEAAKEKNEEAVSKNSSELRRLHYIARLQLKSFEKFLYEEKKPLDKEYANTPLGKIEKLPGASAILDFLNDLQRGYYRLRR